MRLPPQNVKVKPSEYNYPELIYPKPTTLAQSTIKYRKLFYLSQDKLEKSQFIKECPDIEKPQFSGFFTIHGNDQPEGEADHTLLLAIDNAKQIFVVYDNNYKFHTAKNLEECFETINGLWSIYKYKTRTFCPYIFETPEIKA